MERLRLANEAASPSFVRAGTAATKTGAVVIDTGPIFPRATATLLLASVASGRALPLDPVADEDANAGATATAAAAIAAAMFTGGATGTAAAAVAAAMFTAGAIAAAVAGITGRGDNGRAAAGVATMGWGEIRRAMAARWAGSFRVSRGLLAAAGDQLRRTTAFGLSVRRRAVPSATGWGEAAMAAEAAAAATVTLVAVRGLLVVVAVLLRG